ncbi:MAG: hypothetical protein M3Z30_09345 [Gemmatimonadota bacterium]|nr:hypothetical protein [Gemmatimonadota bacterium]
MTGTTPVSGDTRALAASEAATSIDFPGWGKAERMDSLDEGDPRITHLDQPFKHRLGVWGATAIGGNDITSSVLYVSALAAAEAVESCLPLNGRTFTVHLNTTNKKTAAAGARVQLSCPTSRQPSSARAGPCTTLTTLWEAATSVPNSPSSSRRLTGYTPELRIDLLLVRGSFAPAMIERLAQRLRVRKNLMFIGTPGDRFPHRIDSLGGVRVIL